MTVLTDMTSAIDTCLAAASSFNDAEAALEALTDGVLAARSAALAQAQAARSTAFAAIPASGSNQVGSPRSVIDNSEAQRHQVASQISRVAAFVGRQ